MPIPDYQTLMLPVLQFTANGEEVSLRACVDALAERFGLDEEERTRRMASGAVYISDRISWAKTYLSKAGLLESTRRGHFRITEAGKRVLAQNPPQIDTVFLRQFPDFAAFVGGQGAARRSVNANIVDTPAAQSEEQTPEERIDSANAEIESSLKSSLLAEAHKASPAFFERLILDLLIAMGYGGGKEDAAQRVGRTGDGGIDGIIKEDTLGLDTIYLQAKRYNPNTCIGEPEIRGFSGSLIGKGATKGVFVATCRFSPAAREFAANNRQQKIVLIDGSELTRLMIDYNIGVKVERRVEIKKIDADYFDEYDGA